MFHLNESEREYRHGDHGPKYLEQGPRMNFGVVMLQPGNTVSPHVHRVMQESFYILEGRVTISVLREDGTWVDNREIRAPVSTREVNSHLTEKTGGA